MASTTATNNFVMRLIGAAALDTAIYEEVEADTTANGQALAVVVLSSLAAGIGVRGLGGGSVAGTAFITVVALMAWVAWALVTFEIGARIMPEPQTRSDVGELLRTIGFSSTPGLIRVLAVITPIAIPVFVLSSLWMLAAMVVAVRQALDYQHTSRAIAVCVVGWALAIAMAVALGLFFGPALS